MYTCKLPFNGTKQIAADVNEGANNNPIGLNIEGMICERCHFVSIWTSQRALIEMKQSSLSPV